MARKKTDKAQVPVRMPEPLRARLEKAAKSRAVSMNAEILGRLEQSFVRQEDQFGHRDIYRMFQMAALGLVIIEEQTGKSWRDDPDTKEAVKGSIGRLFDEFGPEGAPQDYFSSLDLGARTTKYLIEGLRKHAEKSK